MTAFDGAAEIGFGRKEERDECVITLARSIASGDIERGIAICGSGVGASIVANKIPGVRAGLIHDVFSARQGVKDDDMNVFCLGGRVIGDGLALQRIVDSMFSQHAKWLKVTLELPWRRKIASLNCLLASH